MPTSPFHLYSKARQLAGYVNGDDRLIAAFASSHIGIYPYQIAAAQFALRSPFLKGIVLADEGSLGKTFEALLIATQRWYEGQNRQLLVLPPNLVRQWVRNIETGFTLPFVVVDTEQAFGSLSEEGGNPFDQEALVITTYDFAVEKAAHVGQIKWDLALFDEASCLCKSHTAEHRTAAALKQATDGAFRLLLTPTPITASILDIYGLLHFIDESVLPDEKAFYDRYFRKPEHYAELSEWVSHYCFRTLKSQVADYVNFTVRIPYVADYTLTPAEKILYQKIEGYLSLPRKLAYPKMERYDLTLMYYHTVSSSAQALCRMLDGAISRLQESQTPALQALSAREIGMLTDLRHCAAEVRVNGKMKALLAVLQKCFARLTKLGTAEKAVVFTDNRVTQKALYGLLHEEGYSVLTYNGDNARDYSVVERFRNHKDIQILLSTDEAAKGLDMEFCPVVVSYDLLYNAVELEQRITRCHRQGQQSDVVVVSLLGKDNFADVRILELINKRVLQFDGIFGLSDNILDNFGADLDEVLQALRPSEAIREQFRQNLTEHREQNLRLTEQAEQSVFTTFTREVADRITLTPQYLEDKIAAVNEALWEVVRGYFGQFNRDHPDTPYTIDEQARTITAPAGDLPQLFYYRSGSRNRPYRSLRQYGMAPDFRPHHGRITLASTLGRHVLDEVCCADEGMITVAAEIEPCTIGFYAVTVAAKGVPGDAGRTYFAFAGRTQSGRILSDRECREIMALPVLAYHEGGVVSEKKVISGQWLVDSEKRVISGQWLVDSEKKVISDQWLVDSEKRVISEKKVISDQWLVDSEKRVISGQWLVDSEKKVISDQWLVDSGKTGVSGQGLRESEKTGDLFAKEKLNTNHSPLTTMSMDSEKKVDSDQWLVISEKKVMSEKTGDLFADEKLTTNHSSLITKETTNHYSLLTNHSNHLPLTTKETTILRSNYNSRIFTVGIPCRPDPVDTLIPTEEYIARRLNERDSAQAEELARMKHRTAVAKTGLARQVAALEARIKVAEREVEEAADRIGKLQADKRLKLLRREWQQRRDNLYLDRMRLDLQLEQEVEAFVATQQLTATVRRHFLVVVSGQGLVVSE